MRYHITDEFDSLVDGSLTSDNKELSIIVAKHLNRNVFDTEESVEVFHYASWKFDLDKFLYSIPDREPKVMCAKCGKNDVVNKQKYCGNGSDKENMHKWLSLECVPKERKEQEIQLCKELREKYSKNV